MLVTANLANYETLPCGKILCILHRQCGCRWPGSLNFLTERAHVFQYVCVFNQSKAPQFLSHARGCLFVIPERKLFSEPPPALVTIVPINFFANIQILGLKIPGSLNLQSTKHPRWKQIQTLICLYKEFLYSSGSVDGNKDILGCYMSITLHIMIWRFPEIGVPLFIMHINRINGTFRVQKWRYCTI